MNKIKILVISHNCFSKVGNNGKTYESFFEGFNGKNLAQLFFVNDTNIDLDFCHNYFKITDVDVLNSIIKCRSKCGGIVLQSEEKKVHSDGLKTFNKFKRKSKYLTLARDILWKCNLWKTKDLKVWLKDFNPDIIFFVGGFAGFSHNIACYTSKLLKKPLVTYFTDDYIIYPKNRHVLDKIQRGKMKRVYNNTIKKSALLFAIGDLMAAEYTNYFGTKFHPIMNSVPIESYTEYKKRDQITVSYFGGLHLNRWKMIVRFAQAVGDNAKINVYTISKPEEEIMSEFSRVGINYCGRVEGDELKKAMINSDALLHVESDDVYNKSLTRLSVSTKIPEYLMSGRLVIGYGPTEVASMRLLADNDVGVVISSELNDSELKSQLISVFSDSAKMKSIGVKGYKFVCDKFDHTKIVDGFVNKLQQIIK